MYYYTTQTPYRYGYAASETVWHAAVAAVAFALIVRRRRGAEAPAVTGITGETRRCLAAATVRARVWPSARPEYVC